MTTPGKQEWLTMGNARHRKAFTLIEVLIVVVIMAVLAATVIPQFSSSTQDAMESTLRFNVHTMRSQIELYKVHHGAYPTISDDSLPQLTSATNLAGLTGQPGDAFPFGPYIDGDLPTNPVNNLNTVAAPGGGESGWQYDAATGAIWPNHEGWTPSDWIP